jgi:S-adenosylmethionine:diacylglycerol 3-amino-3-carboxypropyl transferase
MNIVHVVRQFYPAVGGFENVVQELASAQVAAGHRVRVITLNRLFKAKQADVLDAVLMNDNQIWLLRMLFNALKQLHHRDDAFGIKLFGLCCRCLQMQE